MQPITILLHSRSKEKSGRKLPVSKGQYLALFLSLDKREDIRDKMNQVERNIISPESELSCFNQGSGCNFVIKKMKNLLLYFAFFCLPVFYPLSYLLLYTLL